MWLKHKARADKNNQKLKAKPKNKKFSQDKKNEREDKV